jgi:outer membrane protein assembly factor BamE (lipoprotein component of BamABCDE complex)
MPPAIPLLAAALFITGCAGSQFQWHEAARVRVGMTTAQVQQIMGRPYSVVTQGETERWIWSYADVMFTGSVRSFSIQVKNGRVIEVPRIPSNAEM